MNYEPDLDALMQDGFGDEIAPEESLGDPQIDQDRASIEDIAQQNIHLLKETQRRLLEMEMINRVSTVLRAAENLGDMLPTFLAETLDILDTPAGSLALYNPEHRAFEEHFTAGWYANLANHKPHTDQGISARVLESRQVYLTAEFARDPIAYKKAVELTPTGWGGACLPIQSSHEIVGVLYIAVQAPRQLTPDEIQFLTTLTEMAGNAIQRTRLHHKTQQQVQRLASLRTIDNTINASFDVQLTMRVILDQTLEQLQMDAATILLLDPYDQLLRYAAGKGFRGGRFDHLRLRLGESQAGKAALQRKLIALPDLSDIWEPFTQSELLASEEFKAYFAVPLISKGVVKGVIEVFSRLVYHPGEEWLEFFKTLAGQAAIAIDNGNMFHDLQYSHMALALAYDHTLEGWASALEYRDQETRGHSQRVTEMTLALARHMELTGKELIHIRRGALLHDIGKMGVPDNILHKPGPLTEDEWTIMRQHPVYAYEMLKKIEYLRPALDIPLSHHEKWDGSGYPQGLVGEQIPLAARIFAIVDVWDALRSDRPYRKSWTDDQVMAYLQEQSGQHFDPRVLENFLDLIRSQNAISTPLRNGYADLMLDIAESGSISQFR